MVELKHRLLVGEAAEEGLRVLLGAEEADAAAFQLLVDGGVALLVVVAEGEAILVHREGDEVVRGEFEREIFPEH